MRSLIPNSTQIPDIILDEWMPSLSFAEFTVVMFVARKTFGWGKRHDKISAKQMAAGTGMSERNVIRVCDALIARKFLFCRQSQDGHTPNDYALNLDAEMPECQGCQKVTPDTVSPLTQGHAGGDTMSPPGPDTKSDTRDRERDTKKEVPQTPKKASTPRGSAPLSEAVRLFHERRIAVKGRAPCRDARLEARCDRLLRDSGPEAFCRALDGYFGCLGGTEMYPEQVGFDLVTFVRQFDRWEGGAREFKTPSRSRAAGPSPSQPSEQFQRQMTGAEYRAFEIAQGRPDPMAG